MAGLMERCINTKALLPEISHTVPRPLRKRMNIVTVQTLNAKRKNLEEATSNGDTEEQSDCKKFRAMNPSYTPIVLESVSSIERLNVNLPEVASMRIPGALIIDPQVRKLAETHGLKVSEHAIWLLNVAVREFAISFISKTLSTKEAVILGHVPQHLTRQFGALDNLGAKGRNDMLTHTQNKTNISSSDLHALIANLPISSRSLSGTVSRTLFERSLGSAVDNSLVLGGSAFDELKKHIIKNVTPIESKGPRSDYLAVPPTQILHHGNTHSAHDTTKDRMAYPVRGLGRGAKDLAALKARASTVTSRQSSKDASAINESVVKPAFASSSSPTMASLGAAWIGEADPTTQTTNIQASPMGHRSAAKTNIASQQDKVSAKANPELDVLDRVSGSSETSDAKSLSQVSRRGKGHGVKNLAAMRARSVPSSSDLAATDDDVNVTATETSANSNTNDPRTAGTDSEAISKHSDVNEVSNLDGDVVAIAKLNNFETARTKPMVQMAISDSEVAVQTLSIVTAVSVPVSGNEVLSQENEAQVDALCPLTRVSKSITDSVIHNLGNVVTTLELDEADENIRLNVQSASADSKIVNVKKSEDDRSSRNELEAKAMESSDTPCNDINSKVNGNNPTNSNANKAPIDAEEIEAESLKVIPVVQTLMVDSTHQPEIQPLSADKALTIPLTNTVEVLPAESTVPKTEDVSDLSSGGAVPNDGTNDEEVIA